MASGPACSEQSCTASSRGRSPRSFPPASRDARISGMQRLFSVEFFPPKTEEGIEKLRVARRQLAQGKPAFFSVTFGAGGSTREGTLATVLEMRSEGLNAVPHISCIGSTRAGLREVLAQYRDHG